MPKFYAYTRISHLDQEKGDSIAGQKLRGQNYHRDNYPDHAWGGIFEEPGHVSARSIPFMRRKAGKEAILTLQAGDVLYVDKVDRLWRNIHDFSDLLRWFKNHQIVVVFGNLMGASFKTDTPFGDFMLGLLVMIGQLESDQISDRICTSFKHEKETGFYPHRASLAPLGTKAITAMPYVRNKAGRPKKMLAWDMPKRLIMAEIVMLRDVNKMTWQAISDLLTFRIETYVPNYEERRIWHWQQCAWAYALEKQYALVQNPRYMALNTLPTFHEVASQESASGQKMGSPAKYRLARQARAARQAAAAAGH